MKSFKIYLPTVKRDGFNDVWRIEIPGTIIAGSVLERNNGGGILFELFTLAVWAAIAAAAALVLREKKTRKKEMKMVYN